MSTGTIGQPSAARRSTAAANHAAIAGLIEHVGRPRRGHADAWRPGHRWRPARASGCPLPPCITAATAAASATVRGEHRRAVEAAHRRHDADVAHPPDGRLQPDDPVQRRRHPARAGGVGAQGERHQPEGHGHGRAGARSAGHERRVERRSAACRTASGCRPGRWRTGRGWPCRRRSPRRRAAGRRCRRRRRGRTPTPGHAAVVGTPATSMLSLTTNGTPYSGMRRRVDAVERGGVGPGRARRTARRSARRRRASSAASTRRRPRPCLARRSAAIGRRRVGDAPSRAERGEQRRPRWRPRRTPLPASSPSSAPRRGWPGRSPRCSR